MAIKAVSPGEPEFTLETETVGRIDALPLTLATMEALDNIEGEGATEFIKRLVAAIGRKSDGSALSKDEAANFSDAERDEFAAKFIESHQYLYRERVREDRRDEAGRKVISFRDDGVKHPKADGESDSVYLFRLFKIWCARQEEAVRPLLKNFQHIFDDHKRIFTPSFQQAFKHTQSVAAQLNNTIGRMRADMPDLSRFDMARTLGGVVQGRIEPSRPEFPALLPIPNPVHDTNKKLSEVLGRLGSMEALTIQMAETVSGVSASASEFLVAFGAVSEKADRTSRRAIWIAALAIVVAVLSSLTQIGYSEWRNARDQAATDATVAAISKKIDNVAKAEHDSIEQAAVSVKKGDQEIQSSFDRLSASIEALAKSFQQGGNSPLPAGK